MTLLEKLQEMERWVSQVRTALESENPSDWEEGADAADELGVYDDYQAEIAEKSAELKESRQMAAAEARYERRREHERNS